MNFYFSKFIIHCSLMLFTIFFSLKLDGTIQWNYWAVFAPIWFWKLMVILGAAVGSYVWWRYPHFRFVSVLMFSNCCLKIKLLIFKFPIYRLEGEAYIHYKAMLITLALHLILLMFELLACDKLQSGRHLWILVFIPLIFISVVSIAVCIWAVKHDRSFEVIKSTKVNLNVHTT